MVIKIIGAMRHFKLEDANIFSIGNIDMCSDHSVKERDFINADFLSQFGLISEASFDKKWCFASSIFTHEIHQDNPSILDYQVELAKHVHNFVFDIHGVQAFLWFIKDNCCMSSDVFGQGIDKKTMVFTSRMSSGTYSNSKGEFNDESFTIEQLKQVLEIQEKFKSICPDNNDYQEGNEYIEQLKSSGVFGDYVIKADNHPEKYHELNRLQRAFRFIHIARTTHYLPQKIAMYIPVFECLFSSEASEATQKVSERVAFYLSNDNEVRRNIFDIISKGYNIRSRYLHGSVIDKQQRGRDFQTKISTCLDKLAREILVKILTFDSDKFIGQEETKVGEFLKGIIFQPSPDKLSEPLQPTE